MVVSTIIVFVATLIIMSAYKHRCRRAKLPGPALADFTKLVRVWLLIQGDGPSKYLEMHKKYGPLVKTGPNHVSLASADSISVIYDLKGKFKKVVAALRVGEIADV